jgi:hypothetical protein
MFEWLQIAVGVLISLLILCGVFYFATAPRPRGKRSSWLAPPSGDRHDAPSDGGNY